MEKERKNKENKKEKEREIKNAAELLFILKKDLSLFARFTIVFFKLQIN